METKNKTNSITIEFVLLSLLFSGCRDALPGPTNVQQSATESTVSVPKKQPIAMDSICDLTLFGENLGDDAHTTNTGDIDCDSYTDLIIGAQFHNSNHGRAYLYYGGPKGLSSKPDIIFDGEPDSHLGWSIGIGDVDNDGYDDLAIGARKWQSNSEQGRVYVYHGGPTILRNVAAADREESPTKSLHRAASDGDIDLVRSLISKGANVNSFDEAHRTPIHSAVMQGHREVVEFLVTSGVDINAKDKWGYAPIDVVGTRNRKEILELLAKNGATISTIHIAASVGNLTKVKAFVQEGINVNGLYGNGCTPLHFAAQDGQTDIVEFLIAKGADVNAENR